MHLPEIFPERQPVTWRTYKLLRRLQNSVITRSQDLGDIEPPLHVECHCTVESRASYKLESPRLISSKPLASIVIPTRDRVDELRNLLRSALMQTVPVEIHVMDDGEGGATAEMIQREFPQVQYHRCGTNRGPAFQRNRGIELASCNFVFPVDDDALFVSPCTIEQTLAEFNGPRIGVVGIPYINVRQDQIVQQRAPEDDKIYVTSAFVGAAHAVRRDVFLSVKGFREHFFIMGEEGDLSLRMLNAGYLTRLGTADPLYHLESPRRDFRRMDYYGRRNDVLFAWHNVPTRNLGIHLVGTTLNGIATAVSVGRFSAMLQGIARGYVDCFRLWKRRYPVRRDIYQLHRLLKKKGPQLLSDIENLLPPLENSQSTSQDNNVAAAEQTNSCAGVARSP